MVRFFRYVIVDWKIFRKFIERNRKHEKTSIEQNLSVGQCVQRRTRSRLCGGDGRNME